MSETLSIVHRLSSRIHRLGFSTCQSCIVKENDAKRTQGSGGSRGGARAPLFWVKKRRNYRRKKSRQGKQNTPPRPPLAQGLDPPLQGTRWLRRKLGNMLAARSQHAVLFLFSLSVVLSI